MIGSLHGRVLGWLGNALIIETESGVGYKVAVTGILPTVNDEIRLFIHHHVREDASDLYGFGSLEELEIFHQLLAVPGIGPKMSQTIVGSLGRQAIISAIQQQQVAPFRSVSGVGQKLAEKIIVELKSKVRLDGTSVNNLAIKTDQVFEALQNLGYQTEEISQALQGLDPGLPEEERLRQALRLLAR